MVKIFAALAAVIALGLFATSVHAGSPVERIFNDPGGSIDAYQHKYSELRALGTRVVVDGSCLSACTLITSYIPRDRVCVTDRAVLGFHAASLYDEASGLLEPTRRGTRYVFSLYPVSIRNWITRNGGLTPNLIFLQGAQLHRFYQACN